MTRLGRLKSVQAAVSGSVEPQTSYSLPQNDQPVITNANQFEQPSNHWGTYTSELSFDKHFILKNANGNCWQFFGSSSAYALAVEILVHAESKLGKVVLDQGENYNAPQFWLYSHETSEPPKSRPKPSKSEVQMLVNLYMETTNILNSVFDREAVIDDIDTYLSYHGGNLRALTGKDAHLFFRISLMCAIASANKARHFPAYAAESVGYFNEGLQCVEEVTSDTSPEALQALMLLIIYALFYPREGDIWKLLDFACRLSVELKYHCEPNDEYEDEKTARRRRSMFWGLYRIERSIGQHFGRPSDLPEEIITVEYPSPLDSSKMSEFEYYQCALSAHFDRLTYLRSEIFRELYLPAAAPEPGRLWYEQRLESIIAWRRELQFFDTMAGMGSLTCEMGFDTTICFLFQSVILRALVATKEPMLPPDSTDLIPRESYHSACKVVDFYNRLFRGGENTQLGMYPLTIIGAHYIYQATFTIMAHCLLAIDGRLPVVTFSTELSGDVEGPINFHGIYEISGTCLILLSTLAKKWPGMVGALDIYKNLQDKILPIMMRSGLG